MDLQEFVKQCETAVLQAQDLRQCLQTEKSTVSNILTDILQYKTIIKECTDQTQRVKEIQTENEKIEIEMIRTKQQKTKEMHRHERFQEIIHNLLKSKERGISEKDEQVMYKVQLKNYLIRRITGVNLNMDEMTKGNVSGWISKLRLSTFQTFEWAKGEKTDEEARDFLWDLSAKMDPVSHESWNQKGLFGDD